MGKGGTDGNGPINTYREAAGSAGLVSVELLQVTVIYHIYQKRRRYFECSHGVKG